MPQPRRTTHDGFTLIEVLIALFLLAAVALILADLTCRAVRVTARSRRQTVMAMLAVARVEQLAGLTWGMGEAAAPVRVQDTVTALGGRRPSAGGTGLGVSPADALAVDEPGYVDFADRGGSWIGSGPGVPPGAAFVRRWRVLPVPAAPDCLAIEVFVDVVDGFPGRAGARSAFAVRLTAVKARKAA